MDARSVRHPSGLETCGPSVGLVGRPSPNCKKKVHHWTVYVLPMAVNLPHMKKQLEITFESSKPLRPPCRSEQRRQIAQFWFSKMRRVVDCAIDWKNAAQTPAVQTYFALEKRR